MVVEICRDIKKLDFAKKNLTSTITALRRLGMLGACAGASAGPSRRWGETCRTKGLVSAPAHRPGPLVRVRSVGCGPAGRRGQPEAVPRRRQLAGGAVPRALRVPLPSSHHLSTPQAVNQLSAHFESYKDIPRIGELRSKVTSIKNGLRTAVFDDFSRFGHGDEEASYSGGELADACLVVDALEPHVREELVATLCSRELGTYAQIFSASSGESSHLDKVDRRYAYIRRKIAEREAAWGVFPPTWRVGAIIVAALCKLTRAHVGEMLDTQASSDVQGVLSALHRTLEFEKELDERFGGAHRAEHSDDEEGGDNDEDEFAPADEESAAALRRKYEKQRRQREHDAATGSKLGAMESAAKEAGRMSFRGTISGVFEGHLRGYVELEEKALVEGLEALLAAETWQADAGAMANPDAPKVLSSASQVFLNIKKVLKRGSGLTRGSGLLALGLVFGRVLRLYAARLAQRLPKDSATFTDGDERVACFISHTAEYCRDTCAPLAESLGRMLEAPWAERLDFGPVEEEFNGLLTQALGVLAAGAETRLEQVLAAMLRCKWAELEAVGDQSEYVSQLNSTLQAYVPQLGALLGKTYFHFFCEKLAASFAPKFYAACFKCRRFNDAGAAQLLLDCHAIKQILLDVPTMGAHGAGGAGDGADTLLPQAGGAHALPAGYAKLIGREMSKAESLLKVIQAPQEAVGDMFRQLLPDAGLPELRLVCELRGMKRTDAQALLEDAAAKGLGGAAALGGARPITGPASGLSSMPSLRLGGGLAGLSDLGSGLREGLGELRVGLADRSLPDFKSLKGAFTSGGGGDDAPAPAANKLQPGEAFRSAGRKLGDMGRVIKLGLMEAQEGLKDSSAGGGIGRTPSGSISQAEEPPKAGIKTGLKSLFN